MFSRRSEIFQPAASRDLDETLEDAAFPKVMILIEDQMILRAKVVRQREGSFWSLRPSSLGASSLEAPRKAVALFWFAGDRRVPLGTKRSFCCLGFKLYNVVIYV